MPRKARIDAPGALQHIIVRGIERRLIFCDDQDRDNFIERLGDIFTEGFSATELSKKFGISQPAASISVKRCDKIAKAEQLELEDN